MEGSQQLTTEERIIRAAEAVFTSRGKSGGRMRDIAERAGINQALLHYYFRSKDLLFDEVFRRVLPRVFPGVFTILNEEIPLFEKIEKFIHSYIGAIEEHPEFPMFIIQALGNYPVEYADAIVSTLQDIGFNPVEKIEIDVRREIEAGRIREIDPRHLMVNMISLSVFPFLARPMIERIAFPGEEERYRDFLDQRKEQVTRFVINSIKRG